MKQKIVGIVPFAPDFGQKESRYDDKYLFTDTYGVRVLEAGFLPIGVLPVRGRIRTDVLELCDSFILQGGAGVGPHHLEVIDHALKTGKKVLGICLGCQSIQCYFGAKADAEACGYTGSPADFFVKVREERNHSYLAEVKGHHPLPVLPRDDVSPSKHLVLLQEDSHIARLLGVTRIMGASFHYYCIGDPAPDLIVSGRAEDGTIEAVEYGDTIIGTQFHPDVDNELHQLFDWLGE